MGNNNEKVFEIPKIVFIDTSAIDPMYNDYGKMQDEFNFLQKWVDENKIVLLVNEIVLREVKSHIKEEVHKQVEKINKLLTCRELAIINTQEKYKKTISLLDENKIIKDTYKGFYSLLKKMKVGVLKNGKVSINSILDDYFNNLPPFGTKDKKNEFPDAIMLKSLIREIGQDDIVHIIARDGDWKNVCANNNNFHQYSYIKDFLDCLNKNNKIRPSIIEYIKDVETQKEIIEKLLKIFSSLNYTVNGQEWDRKGVVDGYEYDEVEIIDISNVCFKIDTIENIDNEIQDDNTIFKATLSLISSCDVTAQCSYFDEENSIWDSEDKEYIDKKYGTIIENHEVLLPIRLKIIAKNDNKTENSKVLFNIESFEEIDSDYDISELNNQTLINREYVKNNTDYGWLNGDKFSVERVYKCPHCNKDIKVELISDDTECISGTEREMGAENEYQINVHGICPHCKNRYLVTGFIWEYPILAFNYEQDIKITKD